MKIFKSQLFKILLALIAVLFLNSWAIVAQNDDSIYAFIENEYINNALFYDYTKDIFQVYEGDDIIIDASNFVNNYTDIDSAKIISSDGRDVVQFLSSNVVATYKIEIKEAGFYEMELDYFSIGTSINDISVAVFLNGELPFKEAQTILLKRAWKNATDIQRDVRGNDITPKQVKEAVMLTAYLKDMTGKYSENFSFYFDEGTNYISFYNLGDLLQIDEIRLVGEEKITTYAEYIATKSDIPLYSGKTIRIQGETADLKSDHLLYPRSNRTSPSTLPSHPSEIRINAIGGASWVEAGSWIEWKFDVPEDALYVFTIKYQQDNDYAFSSPRNIYIDGKIPYTEFESYEFNINSNWELETLGDEEEFLVHLAPGTHTIKMEVSLGEKSTVLRTFEAAVLALNNVYKDVIMYTGTSPDTVRDYNIKETITDFQPRLQSIYANLIREYSKLKEISASEKRSIAEVDRMLFQLEDLIEDDDEIIPRLASFKGNISALAVVVDGLRAQALEVDYIEIHSIDANLEKAQIGFFSKILFDLRAFFASFTTNYGEVTNETIGGDILNVWVTTGRDQASIIRSLIDETFTSETNISVNLSIVDTGATLLQAALAGKGPDVAILVPKATPINLAMRGGLIDMRELEGILDIYDRFFPSAFIPYEFNGGLYAIPETQPYNMMFYRKDIFDDFNLEPPQTWDEFYNIISVMQKNNLQVGLAEAQWTFETLLFQRGETFYNENLSETNFYTQEALDAFTQWTDFYNVYGLDRTFDFYNRFRTGEMPIAINSYVMYNQLTVAAPELNGLWDMVPIPGTIDEYGNINRTEGSALGTGSMILKDAKDPQVAFEFINWWTSAETMASYGNELEMIMGPASRLDTANIEAFDLLPWNEKEKENLRTQWEFVTDIPQIPGNYYIERNISNAFRRIVTDFANPREILNLYNNEINAEITRKRKEFGLE